MAPRPPMLELVPELWALLRRDIRVSADFGARKPDPEVFRRFAAVHGRDPGLLAFVDDDLENVEGARAAGWRALHFIDEATIEASLQAPRGEER